MKRHFLFLQGVCSPFFVSLADRLRADGHEVTKINFNVGDLAYWQRHRAYAFRGQLPDLANFLGEIYCKEGITDQVLFGDLRPVHVQAVGKAAAFGVRNHVFEEGYFRPHWITLEREGVNNNSLLPRDPDWFWRVGGKLQSRTEQVHFSSPFKIRAMHDVAYHVAGILNPLLFPNYRTHAPVNAAVEYLGYIRRLPMLRFWKPKDAALIDSLVIQAPPYFVLPLQLNGDAQIRYHSKFEGMESVIDFVLASFARGAPSSARLVIKNHPLDMWLVDYQRLIESLAAHYGLEERVDYLESGNLDLLLSKAHGVVTVNSTVGGISLGLGCPTICLGDPIYNLPGLTFQGSLDDFWMEHRIPDAELFRRFREIVIFATQVNGGFYCDRGIALAVENSARILCSDISPLESLM